MLTDPGALMGCSPECQGSWQVLLLSHCPSSSHHLLSHLPHHLTGEVPEDEMKANVTPFFTKGKKEHSANYRPFSLTSISGK